MATGCCPNSELRYQDGGDLVELGTAKLRHRKSILWPTTRGRDVPKINVKEFTIVPNEIQHIVIRNSIGWTEEKCIAMDELAQEGHSYCPSSEEYDRYKKILVHHTEQIKQKCTDETPIRLPNSSHNNELSPP